MDKELECTKIKDGLYLGNIKTAQDAEFLITNKFAYIVNCSAEIPNYFEGQGIKYLKFKLGRAKAHKLWDEPLKKLKKLDKFIQTCEEHSMCCLIHSYDGANRSLAMLVAFLMNRYKWKLSKALEFLRSKQLFIGLSEHYIEQLEILESMLQESGIILSENWRIQYNCPQEEIVSKTFLNSQQIEVNELQKKQKKIKRITWKDQIDKEKKKQQKQLIRQQQRERGLKIKSGDKIDLSKKSDKEVDQKQKKGKGEAKKDLAGFKRVKNAGNKSKPQIVMRETETQPAGCESNIEKKIEQQQEEEEDGDLDEDLIKLLKKNLKSKKKMEPSVLNMTSENEEKVYNVTINNYIKPNINILNHAPPPKKRTQKQRPQSAWNKDRININRTMSEKETIRPVVRDVGNPMNAKEKSLKSMPKKGDVSPRRRDKKTSKTSSLVSKGK